MMNKRLLKRALQREKAKRALGISVIVHVILSVAYVLFFIPTVVQEAEDAIPVDLISEIPDEPIVKKKMVPIAVKELEPETVKIPETMEEPVIKPRQSDIRKEANVVNPKHSLEIAKLPSSAPVDIPTKQTETVEPELNVPDIATTVDLTPNPESVLSSTASEIGDSPRKSFGKRDGTGVRRPGKGKNTGIYNSIKVTGATDGGTDIGSGVKGGRGVGKGGSAFVNTIKSLAEDIIEKSGGAPIDVVFVVDTSGSMRDNIKAVPQHLGQMIDVYEASECDYALGLTLFTTSREGNDIEIHQLTTNVDYIRQPLYEIVATNGQNILDAIDQTVRQIRFRKNTNKHLILVSDEESLSSVNGLTAEQVIRQCQKNRIHVNVLGVNNSGHKSIARETGGTWHAIPQDTISQSPPKSKPNTTLAIRNAILNDAVNKPVDIILFIDGSRSMVDQIPYLKQQIDLWLRDWDNALIDYRLGVVRFRASGTVNMVNVFNPPQTQGQVHKILKLPCQDDENLLQAVVDATRQLRLRPNTKTHYIIFTDEPGNPKYPTAGTIQYLKEIPVTISVVGTTDTFQQQVARQTGGIWIAIPNANKINEPYH